MATVLSVGDVVRFDVAFVEQMMKKLAARRPAGPSFCLLVRPAADPSKGEQAVFTELSSGTVERTARPADVTLRMSSADLEGVLQGRVNADDFVRRIEIEATPPGAVTALIAALRPEAAPQAAQARDLGGEAQERRYATAGGDGMIDEDGRRVKGKPQPFKVKVKAAAPIKPSVTGGGRAASDSHGFARDNLLRALQPIAQFADEQRADAFRVQAGMASVKAADAWRELGRLGD